MRLSPASTSPDSIAALMNDEEIAVFDASQRADALAALLRIENPGSHSPTTVDCGSCHMASPVMSRQAPLLGLSRSGNPAAFVPDGTWVLPSEMQPIEPITGFLNVHAFSYALRQQVAVNQRTVNESAAVVQYLNANLLK